MKRNSRYKRTSEVTEDTTSKIQKIEMHEKTIDLADTSQMPIIIREGTKKKKIKKRTRKQYLWVIILLISLIILGYAGFKIINWYQDNKKTSKQIEEIDQTVKVEEVPASNEDTLVNEPKKDDKNNDYWNYIKLPLINVNFNDLMNKNPDTVGFLKVNGTNINYPVVQTNDNKFYLNHSFDKSYNEAGWVFMDYRNDVNQLSDNTIIYAHGRWDTTMFGSLKNVFKNNWYQNTDNYVVHLSTPAYNSLWQVFSVYTIPTETYYITSNFGTDESYQKFLTIIQSRSVYKFNASVNTNDKILTLSTCLNNKEKVVLHAKLIKLQYK